MLNMQQVCIKYETTVQSRTGWLWIAPSDLLCGRLVSTIGHILACSFLSPRRKIVRISQQSKKWKQGVTWYSGYSDPPRTSTLLSSVSSPSLFSPFLSDYLQMKTTKAEMIYILFNGSNLTCLLDSGWFGWIQNLSWI